MVLIAAGDSPKRIPAKPAIRLTTTQQRPLDLFGLTKISPDRIALIEVSSI
ncbi:unnamed protein product [Nippostrongylus brasiliensis]|uniref:ABC transporter ATP-binding protein n=1 Tax=Nippostrongylus brasiliensis TaxID=27835 RepID=A0A0N4XPT8_NIPBR|nr:unnamed protein product [Nippostrongylus brasiliensis]